MLKRVKLANEFHEKKKKNIVKAQVMYGCENWTIKKAEHRRISVSKL